ncbi:MAG TPA: hypothetical protein VL463_22625 [Kofleriaceae bacterium]|nr:hypothetical protein [Kofleriaceae bacterium]
MSAPAEHKATRAVPADVAIAVIGLSEGASYDMFDVVALDGAAVKVRGSLLLEISEEVPLRVSRNGSSVDVRARVMGHERGAGGAVTELVLVDGETELRRLLGAS